MLVPTAASLGERFEWENGLMQDMPLLFCPNCGRESGAGLKFCRACGMNVELTARALAGTLGPAANDHMFGSDRKVDDALVRRYFGAEKMAS